MRRLLHALQGVMPTPDVQPLATFTAVMATALATVVTGVNLFLGLMMLVSMLLDQLSGILRAVVMSERGADWFDSRKFFHGFAKNGLILLGVLTAGMMEMASLHVPAWGEVAAELTPLTKLALAYAITGKISSIMRNIGVVKEAQLLTAFMTRRIDSARLGYEPPERRHYDAGAVHMERTLETPAGEPFHDAAKRRDQEREP